MSRKIFSGLTLTLALWVAGAGAARGQEPPEPPEPPHPPEPPQVYVLNDGAVQLGVALDDVTPDKAQALKLPAVAGAIVTRVQKGSAAAKAGIEVSDVIMEFDGVRVRSSAELRRLIRETPAGRTVAMKIVREGKTRVLSAKLVASADRFKFTLPEVRIPSVNVPEIHIPPMDFPPFGDHGATLGISADDLTPQLAQYFGVKQGKGVLISEVTTGGPADKAGLKAGDVIVKVDSEPISGVEELREALLDNFTDDTRAVSLTIVRDHHEQTVKAELTHSQKWEKRTSNSALPSFDQQLAQAVGQVSQLRAQAAQVRALAVNQGTLIWDEISKQQQFLQGEWQRQLQEQMRSLKDQLKQLQYVQIMQPQDGEL